MPTFMLPAACRAICMAAAAELRPHYDHLPERQLAPAYDLYLQ